MKISSVTVTFAATINTGNYSNLRPEITLTADLEENDVPNIITNELLLQAKRQMIQYIHLVAQTQVNDLTAPYAEGDDPKQIERWLENQTPLYAWLKEYDPTIKLLPKLAERCPECKTLKVNDVCHNRQCEKSPDYKPPVTHTAFRVGDWVDNTESKLRGKVIDISPNPKAAEPYRIKWDGQDEPEWVFEDTIKESEIPF